MKLQKETKVAKSLDNRSHGKWYDDACGTAFAMELIGERWSLLVIRELMLGGLRFSDLRAGLPGVSAKVLTERLASLEAAGVLERRQLPPPAATQVYELTRWGYLAEPAILELGRWAARSSRHDPTLPLSPVSLMLSFRTMVDRARVGDMTAQIGFDVAGQHFIARTGPDGLSIVRVPRTEGDAVFRTPSAPIVAGAFYGKIPFAELVEAGLRVEGDEQLARWFVDLFHLPEKVG